MLFTSCLLLWGGLVAGACAQTKKLLIGAPGQILAADFDGTSFDIVANVSEAGTGPSWMLFKEPDILYVVNENSNNTRLFKVRARQWPAFVSRDAF